MSFLRIKLSSQKLVHRVIYTTFLFLVLFLSITIISYYFLPEGLLKSKNPLHNWENSSNTLLLIFQIFFYNMLSVVVIAIGSLFGQKKEIEANYLSIGYLAFFVMISQNAVVLGTWSFSVVSAAPSLFHRLIGSFDLLHRAGLWEMFGQLLITCSLAHIATIRSSGKKTETRKLREIHLSKNETLVLLTGFAFMLTGAIIEGISIHSL